MHKNLLYIFISLSFLTTSAQIGINTTSIDNGVMLEIDSNDSGILLPRISLSSITDNTTISGTLTNGTLIYNTTNNASLQEGFYYWENNTWVLINTGVADNIYNANGALNEDRTLDLDGRALNIQSGTNDGFRFNSNGSIALEAYGVGTFQAVPTQFLTVDTNGNVVEFDPERAYSLANQDWFEENTTSPPNSINDNIFTNGEVGINTNNPLAPLHVYEANGTVAGPAAGTILLQHGNNTGESSIVFRSAVNGNSDYGYIKYQTDGSGNGTGNENGLLTIGVENDNPGSGPQDDININSSGSLGINTTAPAPSASIDMGRINQGLLINRVRLLNSTDTATIVGAEPDGLLVYNTTAAGNLPNNVVEGFYYWNNARWNLLQTIGGENNLYNSNGTLTNDRSINLSGNTLGFSNGVNGRDLTLTPANINDNDSPYIFQTNNSLRFDVDDTAAINLKSNASLSFGDYGKGQNTGTEVYSLGVDAAGNVLEKSINRGVQFYSYDIPNFTNVDGPNLANLISTTKITNSGSYNGSLSANGTNGGAFSVMNPTTDNDSFVIKIVGTYEVKIPGNFTINEVADDGIRIYIDGALIVNNWKDGAGDASSGTVNLAKGKHKFEFWYFERQGEQSFSFSWGTNPDGNSGVINATQFTIE